MQCWGLRLIGYAFAALAVYLLVQSMVLASAITGGIPAWRRLDRRDRPVTFTLAAGKARTGRALDNPVLRTGAGSR